MSAPLSSPNPHRPIDGDLSHFGPEFFAPDGPEDTEFYGLDYKYPYAPPTNPNEVLFGLDSLPHESQRPTVYFQPLLREHGTAQPLRMTEQYYLDHLAPKQDQTTTQLANPNTVSYPHRTTEVIPFPQGTIPFDRLVFGGIRRKWFERKFLRKPGEKLIEAQREQDFYRSLASDAFRGAGLHIDLPLPIGTGIPPKGIAQRRARREVMGHKGWVRKRKFVPGHAQTLEVAVKQQQEVNAASKKLDQMHHKKVNQHAPDISERLARIEAEKPALKKQLADALENLRNMHDSGQISTSAFRKAVLANREWYIAAEREITERHSVHTHRHSHPDKGPRKAVKKHGRKILKATETGQKAKSRKREIEKLEKRVQKAPIKADAKIAKLRRKVYRKDKRKAQIKQTIFDAQSAAARIKNSLKRKDPPEPPVQYMI